MLTVYQIKPLFAFPNTLLADAIDLQLQSRQAYWNVKGLNFMDLRKLFDQVAQGVEGYANLIAERIVQLGGTAEGTARVVAGRSALDGYAHAALFGNDPIDALAQTITTFGRHTRSASKQAIEYRVDQLLVLPGERARGASCGRSAAWLTPSSALIRSSPRNSSEPGKCSMACRKGRCR
jgi:DNA-binding ferritin-like protein